MNTAEIHIKSVYYSKKLNCSTSDFSFDLCLHILGLFRCYFNEWSRFLFVPGPYNIYFNCQANSTCTLSWQKMRGSQHIWRPESSKEMPKLGARMIRGPIWAVIPKKLTSFAGATCTCPGQTCLPSPFFFPKKGIWHRAQRKKVVLMYTMGNVYNNSRCVIIWIELMWSSSSLKNKSWPTLESVTTNSLPF